MQHEHWQSSYVSPDDGVRERLIKRSMENYEGQWYPYTSYVDFLKSNGVLNPKGDMDTFVRHIEKRSSVSKKIYKPLMVTIK